MADEATVRLGLPLLQAGQAQKEIVHNEAIALLDALTQLVVEEVGTTTPPAGPANGKAWVVGTGATAAWAGQDGAVAAWTAGGWRFTAPFEGMSAWSLADAGVARYLGGSWNISRRGTAIADPTGGASADAAARTAIAAILKVMRDRGLIEP